MTELEPTLTMRALPFNHREAMGMNLSPVDARTVHADRALFEHQRRLHCLPRLHMPRSFRPQQHLAQALGHTTEI